MREKEQFNGQTSQNSIGENVLRLTDAIRNANESLTKDECEALSLRFGLEDENLRTREEVAEIIGQSRTMVHRLEQEGIRKAIREPVLSLMKQSLNRLVRHDRHKGREGNYDLDVSLMLAEQAHELAKLLFIVDDADFSGTR